MDEVEVEKEARVMKCFYHPNASFRTFWDFMQVFLLMYHPIYSAVRSVERRLSLAWRQSLADLCVLLTRASEWEVLLTLPHLHSSIT